MTEDEKRKIAASQPNDRPWTYREVAEAINESCTCSGGGPGECCAACNVWHELHGRFG